MKRLFRWKQISPPLKLATLIATFWVPETTKRPRCIMVSDNGSLIFIFRTTQITEIGNLVPRVSHLTLGTRLWNRCPVLSSPEAALLLVSAKDRDLWPPQRSNDWACAWFELFRSLPVPVTFPRWNVQSNSSTSTRYDTNCASVCEWNTVGHLFLRG